METRAIDVIQNPLWWNIWNESWKSTAARNLEDVRLRKSLELSDKEE